MTMRLSLVVPIYNEAPHLERWLGLLYEQDFGVSTEYIFIDDCSTDGSREILRKYPHPATARLIEQQSNQGKGCALRTGFAATTGDVVIVQDADFEYSFSDVSNVVGPILRDEADVVFGSRYKSSQTVHRTFHYAINRVLTLGSNVMSGLYVSDMETCYKAFRGEIIRGIQIESPRFGVEPELTAKIAALKVRVAEVPIKYFPRNYLEGKKIKWTDGVAALWHVARFNLQQSKLRKAVEGVPEQFQVKSGRQWL